jgi:hypothetical protein
MFTRESSLWRLLLPADYEWNKWMKYLCLSMLIFQSVKIMRWYILNWICCLLISSRSQQNEIESVGFACQFLIEMDWKHFTVVMLTQFQWVSINSKGNKGFWNQKFRSAGTWTLKIWNIRRPPFPLSHTTSLISPNIRQFFELFSFLPSFLLSESVVWHSETPVKKRDLREIASIGFWTGVHSRMDQQLIHRLDSEW